MKVFSILLTRIKFSHMLMLQIKIIEDLYTRNYIAFICKIVKIHCKKIVEGVNK